MSGRKGRTDISVPCYIAALEHPLKVGIVALREVVLALDPSVSEETKWNAPSFRTSEHFATMRLRDWDCIQLILHLGARSKGKVTADDIADPQGLLNWLGADRASASFRSADEVAQKRNPLQAILRQWVGHIDTSAG